MIGRLVRLGVAIAVLVAALPAIAQETRSLEDWIRHHDGLVADGRTEDAIAEVRARIEAEPGSPEPRYLLGRLLGNDGNRLQSQDRPRAAEERFEEARLQFQGALEIDINYAPAWRGMAKAHLLTGDAETAEREARRAVDLAPDSIEGRILLAECLYRSGDRPAAFRMLEEYLAKNSGAHDLRFFLASLLANEGRAQDAERELRVVLARAADHVPAHKMLVLLLLSTGRPEEAALACDTALAVAPQNLELLIMLRDIRVRTGDLDGAIQAVERLADLDLTPEQEKKVQEDLARLRAERDRPDRGAELPTYGELLKDLESPDVVVRRNAIRLLAASDLPFVPRAVVKAVTDPDELVRVHAVRILGSRGDSKVAGLLEVLLFHPRDRDASPLVRSWAARGLAALESEAVLPVLVRALDEDDPEILRASITGIADLTGKTFVDDPQAPVPESERAAVRERYRRWWTTTDSGRFWRRKAAVAIGNSGSRGLALYLVTWLEDEDSAMRRSALDALAVLTGDDGWRTLPMGTPEDRRAAVARANERLARPLPEHR